jgi:hypothetical protein
MKMLTIPGVLMLCSSLVMAQSRIEGRLANSKTESLPFVSVVLPHGTDSSFVKDGISDAEGKFT